MAGSSSIRPGTSSGAISSVPVRSPSTTIVPRGSPASVAVTSTWTRAPKRRRTSSSAVRVGLRPTSSISMRDPGSAAAATSQKAADEKSPGTDERWARQRCWPPVTDTVRPSTDRVPPKAVSARSV